MQRYFFKDELGRMAIWDAPDQTVQRPRGSFEVVIAQNARLDGRPVTVLDGCKATP